MSLKSDFIHLFSWFNTCIQPCGRGRQPPGDKILITHFLQVSKKSLWSLILCNCFHDFIHVYSPGAGDDNPLGTKFWCQQEHLFTSVICCKFKKNLFEVWFSTICFMILYMYIAPGQGQTAPRGQSFDVNRNLLSLHSLVASLKKNDFEVWFYTIFFHDLIHVYSPEAGAESPMGQNFDVNRKALSLYPFVASFKEISLKSDFIQFVFHDLMHVYSPGAGGIQPPGDKVLMSTETTCHFGHLLLVSNHRWQ